MNLAKLIEQLIQFALKQDILEHWDVVQVRNQLMEILKIDEPYVGDIIEEELDTPVPILNQLLDYAVEQNIIEDTVSHRDILDAKLMAQLMPRQSELIRKYQTIIEEDNIEMATDYFYKLSQNSNYIRTDRISKNEYWIASTDCGELEITINLSKPEKDPKEIAKARELSQANYPKCFLCIENVGYLGRLNHPARSNHRVIPVTLDKEQWYFQYSPYVYYNEHSIIFKETHTPMKISKDTFVRLLDYIEQYPHYFIGSNADLPIVGGSILSHDHFQGGRYRFPIERATIIERFIHKKHEDVKMGILDWPLSVIRISSTNKRSLIQLADDILSSWRKHTDEECAILAYSVENGEKIPHNTITPIARMNQVGEYELDLVLRNNRKSEEHPDGIFHPHAHLHHIKKENIGLIEVMGLAVLPARLKVELNLIGDILTGRDIDTSKGALEKHQEWIDKLVKKYGANLDKAKANEILKAEVGQIFAEVLKCAGVYKLNEEGIRGFKRFITI